MTPPEQTVTHQPSRARLTVWITRHTDGVIASLFGLASLALYAATAAPSVSNMFDDNLEFQVVIPTLGIPHPTGYPLFIPLAHLFVRLLPWRDPAGSANLVSALAAAVAIALLYLLCRALTQNRLAAGIGALAFAVSEVWWTQATRADVYTAHGILVAGFLYMLLRWESAIRSAIQRSGRWLASAGLLTGLGLVHHRMFVLLLPAALVFILWTDPGILRQPRRWLRPMLLAIAPLPLYLYLPLRGQAVTSLDATYRPTLAGTADWITARPYNAFLTGNPFHFQRDAGFFLAQFRAQLGTVLLVLAVLGLLAAWRSSPQRYALLLLATATQVAFGIAYKVEDIGSFLLPAFMLEAVWATFGVAFLFSGLREVVARWQSARARVALRRAAVAALAALLLAEPLVGAERALPAHNLSHDWRIYDLGQDMVQSMALGGEIVGLLGETTLVRYFCDVLEQRADVSVVAADAEQSRFAAVEGALQRGQPVYLTRDLPGAAQRYSLAAVGPLIAVHRKAQPATPTAGQSIGAGIALVSSRTEVRSTHAGSVLRLIVVWTASGQVRENLKVSARLVDQAGSVVAQADLVPVHFAYPTTAWVPGERIDDVYDLPLPAARPPADYRIQLILYRAATGEEVGQLALQS